MIKNIALTTLFSVFILFAKAQSDSTKTASTSGTVLTAYIDGYYRTDFNGLQSNNKTCFTNSVNKLALGMASVKVDHSMGAFSGTIDIGFGKRAEEFSYNDQGAMTLIKQVYFSYAIHPNVKLSLGKWATHIGYELVDAYANRNYSMSYGFAYGPFFHTGVKADIALGSKSSLMLGVAQPTDFFSASFPNKVFIAQFATATKDDRLKTYINYQGGKDKSQFDVVLNGTVNKQFAVNYDGTICNLGGLTWTSNAFYFNYDPNSVLGFTLRVEKFEDGKNAVGIGTSVMQSTLSANIHYKKFTFIPEIRIDDAKYPIFLNTANAATGNAGSFLIAAIYKF